jgi:hypothetical protein
VTNINTDRNRNRLESFNTFILAFATLGVAWCSYQATLWGGIQTFRLAESNKYGRLAQQKAIQSGQNSAMEEAAVISLVNAVWDNDEKKTHYIIHGVQPELAAVFSNWIQLRKDLGDSAPAHPMATPLYHELVKKRLGESTIMGDKSGAQFKEAENANYNSDKYSFLVVVFSMVMFLGAIMTKLVRNGPRLTIALISTVVCIAAIVWVIFYLPIAHKGE